MSNNPLVSIIVPITRDRFNYLSRLLDMIRSQDYKNIEYIFDCESGLVGEKRNRLCSKANGEIIIHFDSDDIYATDWVSKSVNHLIKTKSDIVGLSSFYLKNGDDNYIYTYPNQSIVAGATMCYLKSYWQHNKFKQMQIGEDNKFCEGAKVSPHNYIDGFICEVHEGNTSKKRLKSDRYTLINHP